mmetsp:Transcript_31488/g.65827  ORF Transcript_31488/g.65827 Transcript_31488/m.65827 type:complete len:206 (-) Transcript_31488:500-1117(-)
MIRSAATHLTRRLAASSSSLASSSAAPISNRSLAPAIAKQTARSIHIEKKIEQLGIELPPAPLPKANYNIVCLPPGEETTMYVSGHLPIKADGTLITGTLGPDHGGMTVEEGCDAARHCALNIIATLKSQLGDLDRVEQVVKVFGIVNSHTEFKHQHLVMDGCSDLIMEVFDKPVGYHARSAIGTNTLPLNAPVEVEAIVKIRPE